MYSQHYTPKELQERLAYDPETGILTWKKCRDSRKIGNPATSLDIAGYVQINIAGKVLKGHRVAWAIYYGKWPIGMIDHKNGVKNDNRIENLRDCDNQTNCQNQRNGMRSNKTGYIGVHIANGGVPEKRYRAKIQFNGKQIHLGGYATALEAFNVYVEAKRKIHSGNML